MRAILCAAVLRLGLPGLVSALLPGVAVLATSLGAVAEAHAAEPAGPEITHGVRPAAVGTWTRACSFRHPVCVQTDRLAAPATALATLAAADRAWDLLTGPLALPTPEPDLLTGAYDVYLSDADGDAHTSTSGRDLRGVDRASAFTVVDRGLTGCALEGAVARELARAALYRTSPSTDEGTAQAQTTALAALMVPCAPLDPGNVASFQEHPERAVPDTWPETDPHVGRTFARGAGLFYAWLDEQFGVSPGAIVRALWALTPSSTPVAARRWTDEPDAFDVLRVTFKNALGTGSTLDDVLLAFSAARVASEPRVRRDWEIPWPAQPRRLSARWPVAPSGASYVTVQRAGARPGARLRVEASWEEHARMRWVVLKLDGAGREISRLLVPSPSEKVTEVQISVAEIDTCAELVIVGVSAGDPAFQLDPHDGAWEPHGWVLGLAAE